MLGTDQLGRDLLYRVALATRMSLASALVSTGLCVSIGLLFGAASSAAGGWLDWVVMRIVDTTLSIPGLVLAMAVIAAMGRGFIPVSVAVGVGLAPVYTRIVRAAFLSAKNEVYIETARLSGAGWFWIATRYIMPSVYQHLTVNAVTLFAWSLLNTAALDFLGMGSELSVASLGRMIGEGRLYLRQAPWTSIVPGVALTLLVVTVYSIVDRYSVADAGTMRVNNMKNATRGWRHLS
nr:ABC transporter permease [Anaerolineae bacterium]